MNTQNRHSLFRFAPLALLLAIHAHAHAAAPPRGPAGQGLPPGWPTDIHLPAVTSVSSSYQTETVHLHSTESADALAAAFDRMLRAAGWTGNFDPPGQGGGTAGKYIHGPNSIQVRLGPQNDGGVVIDFVTDQRNLSAGGRFLAFNELPAGVVAPASAQRLGGQREQECLFLHSSTPVASVADDYRRTMAAAGWTLVHDQVQQGGGVDLDFNRAAPNDTRDVNVVIAPGWRGPGSELTVTSIHLQDVGSH